MPANSPVNTIRREVTEATPLWDLVEDAIKGAYAVKGKKQKYLPQPNPTDLSPENAKRYQSYITRAMFYGVTGRTLVGLVGQVFGKAPVFKAPTILDAMVTSIDGKGSTVVQFAKKIVTHIMSTGRGGIMADMPAKSDGTEISAADVASKTIHPFLRFYKAKDVINWRMGVKNAVKYLELIVMREHDEEPDGDFGMKCVERYRVLNKTDTGVLARVWTKRANGDVFDMTSTGDMKQSNGQDLKAIPFSFIGAEDNTEEIGPIPLYDLADTNIAHYRNSADVEDSSYLVGQPTPVLAGVDEDWVKSVLGGKILFGSRSAIFLPTGATAEMLCAEPNSLPLALMQEKQKQMVALGAKLVESKDVQRTATEVSVDANADRSTLSSVVHNINAAVTYVLGFAYSFMQDGEPSKEELVFEINTDFEAASMNAADRAQLIAEWQAGAIDFEEMRKAMKRTGIAYKDDKEVKDNVAAEIADGIIPDPAPVITPQAQSAKGAPLPV